MYIDVKTCEDCRTKHGKIYGFNAERYQDEHERCRCFIAPMRTKEVGSATDKGCSDTEFDADVVGLQE